MSNHNEISSFIWKVCDDELRGLFKPHEYGDVIIPFVVLRRLDCLLEPKKDEVVELYNQIKVDDQVFPQFVSYLYQSMGKQSRKPL
jgi:type I restriction enzyme M protein